MQRAPLAALLLVAVVLAGCTGGNGTDSDGDGLYDHEESRGWLVTVDYVGQRVEYRATSDPSLEDTDGDGLGDAFEFQTLPPLDPSKADTDGDGLTDCQEALHSVREECESLTWTGMTDGGTGTDPANADSDAGFSRYVNSVLGFDDDAGNAPDPVPWGDGIPDGEELAGYEVTLGDGRVRFVTTDPRNGDTDGDGLEDGEERFLYGSDPTVRNTDGDSCDDGLDPYPAVRELYVPGDVRLELEGTHDVRVQMTLVEHTLYYPSADGKQRVSGSHAFDGGDGLRPRLCTFSARDPWTLVQLQVFAVDGDGGLRNLDVSSIDGNPEQPASVASLVWWNVLDDEFAWTRAGTPAGAPLEWRGEDGSVTFRPTVDEGS